MYGCNISRFVLFAHLCRTKEAVYGIWSTDKFKNSCLVHLKYSKYLLGTQPLPLCWEQYMTLVENTLLICLFIPSLAFLSVLSVRYAAHPLLVNYFFF